MNRVEAVNIMNNKAVNGMIKVSEAQRIAFEIDETSSLQKEINRLNNEIERLNKKNKAICREIISKKNLIAWQKNCIQSLTIQNTNLLKEKYDIKVEEH